MVWTCSQCREEVDEGFEVCWNCGAGVDGTPDPGFQRASGSEERPAEVEEFLETLSNAPGERSCPDCQAAMRPIQLIDSSGQYNTHQQLRYALGDAQRGWFLGQYPVAGVVDAMMCPGCGRILLYGRREG